MAMEAVQAMFLAAMKGKTIDKALECYNSIEEHTPVARKTALPSNRMGEDGPVVAHAIAGRLTFQDFAQHCCGLGFYGLDAARWQYETFTTSGEEIRVSFSKFWEDHFSSVDPEMRLGGMRFGGEVERTALVQSIENKSHAQVKPKS